MAITAKNRWWCIFHEKGDLVEYTFVQTANTSFRMTVTLPAHIYILENPTASELDKLVSSVTSRHPLGHQILPEWNSAYVGIGDLVIVFFSFIADKSLGRLWAQGCINDLCASCLCKSKTNIKYVGQEQENYGQHCLKREISATWVWDWERRDPCFPLARVGLWVPLTQHLHFFSIASI